MNQLTAWEDDRAIGWSWAEGSKGVRHLGGITSDRKGTLSIAAVYVRCGDSPSKSVHSRKKGFSLEVVEKQSRSNWELFSWLQTSEEFCRNFVGRRDQSIHVNKRFVYKIWFQKREARISVQSMRQSLKKIERKKNRRTPNRFNHIEGTVSSEKEESGNRGIRQGDWCWLPVLFGDSGRSSWLLLCTFPFLCLQNPECTVWWHHSHSWLERS